MAPYTPAGKTRRKVYEFMRARILEGRVPSVREVQEAFGFRAVQSAHRHLQTLVKEGLLAQSPGRRSRSYRLPPDSKNNTTPIATLWIPLLGRVQAGELTTALEEPEGYFHRDDSGTRQADLERNTGQTDSAPTGSRKELFALRVRGKSMQNAGIFNGDIVIVRRQSEAESGDIIVALVGDEATVKRLALHRGRVRLLPENDDFEPITPEPADLTILGKVIEIHRYLHGSGGPPLRETPCP